MVIMISKVYNYVNSVPRNTLWRALKRIFLSVKVVVNYVKSKLNAICTELFEVYQYMRAITATGYILS